MAESGGTTVRLAGPEDADAVAKLLGDFNREFDDPAPPTEVLAERVRLLLRGGDTLVLLTPQSEGLAVLRFRLALWSSGSECYLAELYVVPGRRGHGLGRALMESAMEQARARGADFMELGTDETDVVARRLYESLGFTNRANDGSGPIMYFYERHL